MRFDFPDGTHLDEVVSEAILRPYPELWEQWKARVLETKARSYLPPSALRQYYSPTYLHAVIRQYQYLTEGGDRPDPALSARCEAIVAAWPEIAEERRRTLNDPWERALTAEMIGYTPGIANLYDPEDLKRKVDYASMLDDPFSRVSLENDRWCQARRAGGYGSEAAAAGDN